ncbi:MAG: hypothetical protein Ct9H300mP21_10190 [Pseudomonadota bacterium]|nr:MAG: hypothetical protein Ct9H300mP21_10190 [Pseudomonadota bacterium]
MGSGCSGNDKCSGSVLAKELGLCYASVGFVVNMANGMESGPIQLESIGEIWPGTKKK